MQAVPCAGSAPSQQKSPMRAPATCARHGCRKCKTPPLCVDIPLLRGLRAPLLCGKKSNLCGERPGFSGKKPALCGETRRRGCACGGDGSRCRARRASLGRQPTLAAVRRHGAHRSEPAPRHPSQTPTEATSGPRRNPMRQAEWRHREAERARRQPSCHPAASSSWLTKRAGPGRPKAWGLYP
eukprot:scaffold9123_cov121-Isochrysis_galbana.AAC.2